MISSMDLISIQRIVGSERGGISGFSSGTTMLTVRLGGRGKELLEGSKGYVAFFLKEGMAFEEI